MTIEIAFWVCAVSLLYVYAIYPVLIAMAACCFSSDTSPRDLTSQELPTITLIIAAYNEESIIGERIRNALELDYPMKKLEILIALDGCSDRTLDIARQYKDSSVRVIDFQQRRGKASVVNDAVSQATGEIVILSDANTMMRPDAARKLTRWFQFDWVGTVCGRLELLDSAGSPNVDGIYWRYENFLKRCEGRLHAVLGANGAIYAMRRSAYQPIEANTLIDDFVIPLYAKMQTGSRVVFDENAVATEITPPNLTAEFRRRVRIGTGGAQAILRLLPLLHPRHGWTAFAFLSHKVLRWLSPLFLVGLGVSNIALANSQFYLVLLLAQATFYGVALANSRIHVQGSLGRVMRVPTLFVSVNAALMLGMMRWLLGEQSGVWMRTPRSDPNGSSAFFAELKNN